MRDFPFGCVYDLPHAGHYHGDDWCVGYARRALEAPEPPTSEPWGSAILGSYQRLSQPRRVSVAAWPPGLRYPDSP